MKYISQIFLLLCGVVILIVLQYQYWFGENGYEDTAILQDQIKTQQEAYDLLFDKNLVLREDVKDLKSGLAGVEEHARLDLGLIKPNETFVQMSTASNSVSE